MIDRDKELVRAVKKFFDKRALFENTWGGEKSQGSPCFRLSTPFWSQVPSAFLRDIREEARNRRQDILQKFFLKTQKRKELNNENYK